MNQDMWSKSLLASYNYLPIVAKCIDKSNMQMALGSFSYQGNALDLMEKMMQNNNRKRALVNAKVIVDTTLGMLKERNREVLKLRYIKKKSFEQIAELLNICLRSVFRWHDIAIKQFSSLCIMRGYDEKYMQDNYSKDGLFEMCALRCKQEDKSAEDRLKEDKLKKDGKSAQKAEISAPKRARESSKQSVNTMRIANAAAINVSLLRRAN